MDTIIKGSIYLTDDPGMIANNLDRCKVVNVTENGLFLNHPNSIKATILLPPLDAMMADIDNNIDLLRNIYWQYFLSDEITEFMAIICTVLNRGVNIFMYVPKDEINEFSYIGILLEFIRNVYGIYVGTNTSQFGFDINYTQYIADLLFNNNLLSGEEYLQYSNISIAPIESIVKLDQCFRPYIINKTIDSIREYFSRSTQSCIHILTEDEKYDIIRNYGCNTSSTE